MPYLFGIYLLRGSFVLLLFADRLPQIGPNESVEGACERIIRAHEVCVVTLTTELQVSRASVKAYSCQPLMIVVSQKRFRKVLRSILNRVRNPGATNIEERYAREQALFIYRWNNGSTGLAL